MTARNADSTAAPAPSPAPSPARSPSPSPAFDLGDPLTLVGAWQLERTIHDHREGVRMRVAGEARFSPLDIGTVEWVESGLLHLPTGPVPVTSRRLLALDSPGHWSAAFGDGREFHPWLVGEEFVHECAPDLYRGRLESGTGAVWRMTWASVGPRKDYLIESTFTRLP